VVPAFVVFAFTVALAGLFLLTIIPTPSFALVWVRPVVGIVIIGGGRVVPVALSRMLPVLGLGRLWRFVAGNGGFVNWVYVASILRTESWHGRRRYVE